MPLLTSAAIKAASHGFAYALALGFATNQCVRHGGSALGSVVSTIPTIYVPLTPSIFEMNGMKNGQISMSTYGAGCAVCAIWLLSFDVGYYLCDKYSARCRKSWTMMKLCVFLGSFLGLVIPFQLFFRILEIPFIKNDVHIYIGMNIFMILSCTFLCVLHTIYRGKYMLPRYAKLNHAKKNAANAKAESLAEGIKIGANILVENNLKVRSRKHTADISQLLSGSDIQIGVIGHCAVTPPANNTSFVELPLAGSTHNPMVFDSLIESSNASDASSSNINEPQVFVANPMKAEVLPETVYQSASTTYPSSPSRTGEIELPSVDLMADDVNPNDNTNKNNFLVLAEHELVRQMSVTRQTSGEVYTVKGDIDEKPTLGSRLSSQVGAVTQQLARDTSRGLQIIIGNMTEGDNSNRYKELSQLERESVPLMDQYQIHTTANDSDFEASAYRMQTSADQEVPPNIIPVSTDINNRAGVEQPSSSIMGRDVSAAALNTASHQVSVYQRPKDISVTNSSTDLESQQNTVDTSVEDYSRVNQCTVNSTMSMDLLLQASMDERPPQTQTFSQKVSVWSKTAKGDFGYALASAMIVATSLLVMSRFPSLGSLLSMIPAIWYASMAAYWKTKEGAHLMIGSIGVYAVADLSCAFYGIGCAILVEFMSVYAAMAITWCICAFLISVPVGYYGNKFVKGI